MSAALRWQAVRAAVAAAAVRAGREPASVTLVAVAKKHEAAAIDAVYAAGARDIGENYVQEWQRKSGEVQSPVTWHFIGTLQRNKAKFLVGKVALLHDIDSLPLAEAVAQAATKAGVVQAVLMGVNIGGEASKSGVAPEAALPLALAMLALPGLRLQGLMVMPPPADDAEANRGYFQRTRRLRDELAQATGAALPWLSMGMSDDFEVAIAEGATHVRVGTAIFGRRDAGGVTVL